MLIMQGGLKALTLRFFAFLITLILGLSVELVSHIYEHRQGMFTSAAFMGHRFQMKAAYALGVDVNAAACEFRSCFNAVWGAAYGGYDDEIQFLVERGADVNARPTKFRTTALMVASYKGNESTVRLLLSHGSDPNAKREMNAVRYLRVEGKDLENLGIKILRDFYHLAPEAKLQLIIEGFDMND